MKIFTYLIFISFLLIPLSMSFAATDTNAKTGTNSSGSVTDSIDKNKVKSSTGTKSIKSNIFDIDTVSFGETSSGGVNKDRVQQEISSYILEAYKIQGNKILKDIDASLQKMNPDVESRIQAYERIEATLKFRKKRTLENDDISETNQDIIVAYLDFMIQSIDKRKTELSDQK